VTQEVVTIDASPNQFDSSQEADLSTVVIHLLKGILYNDSDAEQWRALLKLQSRVRDYVKVLGLDLHLDEAEGYAFLRTINESDDAPSSIPRLVARRRLSFQVSLILALLRKKMLELDTKGGDTRLIISRDDIIELLRVFLPSGTNEARIIDQVDTSISKIVDLGFLRLLKSQSAHIENYEVRRILKAFIDAQWLASLDQLLEEYSARLMKDVEDDD
jgi:hypothetical protein